MARKRLIVPGAEFERLRVESFSYKKGVHKYWNCLCAPDLEGCGQYTTVQDSALHSGNTRSCGCLRHEPHSTIKIKGGEYSKKEAIELFLHETVPVAEFKRRLAGGMPAEKALTMPYVAPTRYPARYTVYGEKMTLTEAVRRFGPISRQEVYNRMAEGNTLEQALGLKELLPVKPRSKETKPRKRK